MHKSNQTHASPVKSVSLTSDEESAFSIPHPPDAGDMSATSPDIVMPTSPATIPPASSLFLVAPRPLVISSAVEKPRCLSMVLDYRDKKKTNAFSTRLFHLLVPFVANLC